MRFGDPRLPHRFWARVVRGDACWHWTGGKTGKGYGAFHVGGRTLGAHRVAYEALVGPVPDGLVLDHVRARGCTSRACVNPAHLEPVTDGTNVLRGDSVSAVNARKEECRLGHPLAGDNLYVKPNGRRVCKACRRAQQAPWVRAKRRGLDTALTGAPGGRRGP